MNCTCKDWVESGARLVITGPYAGRMIRINYGSPFGKGSAITNCPWCYQPLKDDIEKTTTLGDILRENLGAPSDTVEIPERWENVYTDIACNVIHPTKELADKLAARGRIACIPHDAVKVRRIRP